MLSHSTIYTILIHYLHITNNALTHCITYTYRILILPLLPYISPPGMDFAQVITNYAYFMLRTPVDSWSYKQFEGAIRLVWCSYIEAFDIHADLQCRYILCTTYGVIL